MSAAEVLRALASDFDAEADHLEQDKIRVLLSAPERAKVKTLRECARATRVAAGDA